MLKKQSGEVWREVNFGSIKPKLRYAVSNTGRLASFIDTLEEGRLLKPSLFEGFPGFRVTINKKIKVFLMHRVILESFDFPKPDETHRVIHLDFVKTNNKLGNLKWVNKLDWHAHQDKNPKVLAGRLPKPPEKKPHKGHKLTATNVALIKKKLFDPNRKTRIRLIAKQYGVTEMTLYRIKSGENWAHIPAAS